MTFNPDRPFKTRGGQQILNFHLQRGYWYGTIDRTTYWWFRNGENPNHRILDLINDSDISTESHISVKKIVSSAKKLIQTWENNQTKEELDDAITELEMMIISERIKNDMQKIQV